MLANHLVTNDGATLSKVSRNVDSGIFSILFANLSQVLVQNEREGKEKNVLRRSTRKVWATTLHPEVKKLQQMAETT